MLITIPDIFRKQKPHGMRVRPKELRNKHIKANEEKKILKRSPTLIETTYWVEQANKLLA